MHASPYALVEPLAWWIQVCSGWLVKRTSRTPLSVRAVQVDDLSPERKHPFEPFHTLENSDITTRWLNETYPFTLRLVPAAGVR